jgi:hypothetical protein
LLSYGRYNYYDHDHDNLFYDNYNYIYYNHNVEHIYYNHYYVNDYNYPGACGRAVQFPFAMPVRPHLPLRSMLR